MGWQHMASVHGSHAQNLQRGPYVSVFFYNQSIQPQSLMGATIIHTASDPISQKTRFHSGVIQSAYPEKTNNTITTLKQNTVRLENAT